MKESYWGYWLIVLGAFVVIVLLLVQSFTSTNTQDYYMVKTITEAAMEDAIDYSYFRNFGEAKINKEKFEESFIRRFSEEASLTTTYEIAFSDLYEAPPKVSVKVTSKAGGFNVNGSGNDIDIVNKIDAILESSQSQSKRDSEGYLKEFGKGEGTDMTDSSIEHLPEAFKTDSSLKNKFKNKTIYADPSYVGFGGAACNSTDMLFTVDYCGTSKGNDLAKSFRLDSTTNYCVLKSETGCYMIAEYNLLKNLCDHKSVMDEDYHSCN